MRRPIHAVAVSFGLWWLTVAGAPVLGAEDGSPLVNGLRSTIFAVCESGLETPAGVTGAFGPVRAFHDQGFGESRLIRTFEFGGNTKYATTVRLTVFAGAVRRVRGEVNEWLPDGGSRPLLLIDAGDDCAVLSGRRLGYGAGASAERLIHLGPDLAPTGDEELLNPVAPAATDPGGVAVAHIDSGVNYLLPDIAARLARDGEGRIAGYDYWDMDDRPFDLDTARSPFFPVRHGTAVASILLAEAPETRLMPFRYPRPDMSRMAALVDAIAAADARIVQMPLGSRSADEWSAFARAARRHPDILFVVSAGNDGRDIDREPVYPAVLALDNMVVVTSADDFGRLAPGSNWGRRSVDLMVPGENVPVVDHRGARSRASGASFAVPRVAALAARLLARQPEWTAAELASALRARARPPLTRSGSPVAWGWIPRPAEDG